MRRRFSAVLFVAVFVVMALSLSVDLPAAISADGPITVLAIDTSSQDTQILDALTGIDYTIVTPAEFMGTDLSDYQVLYVPSTFLDGGVSMPAQDVLNVLDARKLDIEDFLSTGHGVVALSEPIGSGLYTWLPFPIASTGRSGSDLTYIVDPDHPVMAGLSDMGLSYWSACSHTGFSDPGILSVLAVNHVDVPVILAGEFIAGKVFLTGLDADFHFFRNPRPGKEYVQFLQNAIDWAAQPAIQMISIDVKPCACPNPVNISSKGVLPVAIPGSEALDVYDIDFDSLTLAGVAPVRVNYEDVTAPFAGDEFECGVSDSDGIMDLTLKFDTREIAAALGAVNDGDIVKLELTGALFDGMPIEGADWIVILAKKKK